MRLKLNNKIILDPLRPAVLQLFNCQVNYSTQCISKCLFPTSSRKRQIAKNGWRTVALQSEKFECATLELQFLTCQKVAIIYDCGVRALSRDEICVIITYSCYEYVFVILSRSISWSAIFLNVDTTPVPHSCLLFIDLQGWICYLWMKSVLFIVDIYCSFTLKCVTYIYIIRRFYLEQFKKHVLYLLQLLHRKLCLMYSFDLRPLFIFVWRAT